MCAYSQPGSLFDAPLCLQAQQVQAEADKQVVHLTSSLQQAQSQAAALSVEKERLHAQLQQQAAPAGPAMEAPLPNIPQVSLALLCKHARTGCSLAGTSCNHPGF